MRDFANDINESNSAIHVTAAAPMFSIAVKSFE